MRRLERRRPSIKRLHQDITKLMQTPEMKTAFERDGADIVIMDPKPFGDFIKVEYQKWGKVIRDLNLQVN